MSRPTRPTIDSGSNGWDAVVNTALQQLYDRPLPVFLHAGDLASLEALRPAAQFEWCFAIVDYDGGTSPGKALAFSDGSAWRPASNWQLLHRSTFTEVSSAHAVADGDDTIVVTGASNLTLTLPAIADGNEGRRVRVKHTGTGTVTVATTGGDTVDGAASYAIDTQHSALEFVSDGTGNWLVFGAASGGSGSSTFLGLSDTPGAFEGGRIVASNSGATGLEFIAWTEADLDVLEGAVNTLIADLNTAESDIVALQDRVEAIQVAASDEATAIDATGTKLTFRMPYALTLTGVRASLTGACTTGTFTVDINVGGATVLSTKLTIDAGERTSTTAAVAAVISTAALADDAEVTIDVDDVGDGTATGLKVTLLGTRS